MPPTNRHRLYSGANIGRFDWDCIFFPYAKDYNSKKENWLSTHLDNYLDSLDATTVLDKKTDRVLWIVNKVYFLEERNVVVNFEYCGNWCYVESYGNTDKMEDLEITVNRIVEEHRERNNQRILQRVKREIGRYKSNDR